MTCVGVCATVTTSNSPSALKTTTINRGSMSQCGVVRVSEGKRWNGVKRTSTYLCWEFERKRENFFPSVLKDMRHQWFSKSV